MNKEQAIKLAQRYKAAVAERLPLKALYLYGSYSKGGYTEDSDIDIAVNVRSAKKALNQAVKRNIDRFPEDFMFQLTNEETQKWRSQFVTSNSIKMGISYCQMNTSASLLLQINLEVLIILQAFPVASPLKSGSSK